MKILVIGAEGQVGTFLTRELAARHEVAGTSLHGEGGFPVLDICCGQDVENALAHFHPDHVVLAAAFTAVDQCEQRPDLAEAVNARGPENVARACREIGAGLTFFSTDYIFDGAHGPYTETDEPRPLSVYGRTKLAGEAAVAAHVENHLIVRTMVVYSYLPGSLNLFMQVRARLEKGEPISGPSDQLINPTQAVNLAQTLGELIEEKQTGVFNLAGTTRLPRDEFIRRLVERLGGDPAQVTSRLTSEFKQPALRPLQSGLVLDKAQSVLRKNRLWDLDTALTYTLSQLQGHQA
jgi:dTDP-4-dehydrorhamnose reductase